MTRVVGWGIVGAAFLAAVLIVGRPLVGAIDGYTDVGSLPAQISACGRDWRRTNAPQVWPGSRVPPAFVVHPGPFGVTPCPWSNGPGWVAPTVVFVRVGSDAYAAFELAGGP